jgi:hypothetical protein
MKSDTSLRFKYNIELPWVNWMTPNIQERLDVYDQETSKLMTIIMAYPTYVHDYNTSIKLIKEMCRLSGKNLLLVPFDNCFAICLDSNSNDWRLNET